MKYKSHIGLNHLHLQMNFVISSLSRNLRRSLTTFEMTKVQAGQHIGQSLGQSLLEVLIAITIFSSLTIMLLLSISQLLRRQSVTTKMNLASFQLQETMENLYAISQNDSWWDQFTFGYGTGNPDNPHPYYIKSDDAGGWNITPTETSSQYQAAIYTHPVYRRIQDLSAGQLPQDYSYKF